MPHTGNGTATAMFKHGTHTRQPSQTPAKTARDSGPARVGAQHGHATRTTRLGQTRYPGALRRSGAHGARGSDRAAAQSAAEPFLEHIQASGGSQLRGGGAWRARGRGARRRNNTFGPNALSGRVAPLGRPQRARQRPNGRAERRRAIFRTYTSLWRLAAARRRRLARARPGRASRVTAARGGWPASKGGHICMRMCMASAVSIRLEERWANTSDHSPRAGSSSMCPSGFSTDAHETGHVKSMTCFL